jgi:hypothetical protein
VIGKLQAQGMHAQYLPELKVLKLILKQHQDHRKKCINTEINEQTTEISKMLIKEKS